MDQINYFPTRTIQHITGDKAFRVFSYLIPEEWIIREINKNDYGIDCYIELAFSQNKSCRSYNVTGDLVSIQLKGTTSLKWTKENKYSISNIKKSTTNYWLEFPAPTYIFLIDISKEKIYYKSVAKHVRDYYTEYNDSKKYFSYKISKGNFFNDNLNKFYASYYREKTRSYFEENIVTFLSNARSYKKFIKINIDLDQFLGVEMNRELYIRQFYNNIKYLNSYFDLDWDLPSLEEQKNKGQNRFGKGYNFYESTLTELLKRLHPKINIIALEIKKIMKKERCYWIQKNLLLYNFVLNINKKGSIPNF